MTPERTSEVLVDIIRVLESGHGPTEAQDVTVLNSWSIEDEIFIVYTAPWFDGKLGYRQHLSGWDESELVDDIAHYTIAEPLGRIALVLDPPDDKGITWWDADTSSRIKRLRIEPDPDVPGSGTASWYANPEGPLD
jgi:hypothetical protein